MRKFIAMSAVLILQLCMSNLASAEIADLEATMTLQLGATCPSSFNREIRFQHGCDLDEFPDKDITIHFVRESTSPCSYTGNILNDENLERLKSMTGVNQRSYWDKMFLVNKGGNTALPISEFEVGIRYDNESNPTAGITDGIISGLTASATLTAPTGVLSLSNWKWRACNACRALNNKYPSVFETGCDGRGEINACVNYLNSNFSRWTRAMLYDYGKSGSDDETYYAAEYDDYCSLPGSEENPKFGIDPHKTDTSAICSETASWYYARYAYTCDTSKYPDCYSFYVDNFTDINYAGTLANFFLGEERLYCHRIDEDSRVWQKCLVREKNDDGDYECQTWEDAEEDDAFITPVDGDLLFWPNYGHVEIAVYWDPTITQEGRKNERTEMISGNNLDKAWINKEFCVGRIPDNDGY